MHTATLVTEATRYLEAIDLFRSLELNVRWRSEADEVGALGSLRIMRRSLSCERCAGPLARINGRHICFRPGLP